jgi:MraZ protein
MFRGRHEYTIDQKGRIAIPPRFREVIEQEFDGLPLFVTTLQKCLQAYPTPEWVRMEERAAALPSHDPFVQTWKRFHLSSAIECPMDRQGRILIPPEMRAHAGLERDVILASMGKTFEIWSKDRFQQEISRMLTDPEEVMANLQKFEI